VVLKLFVEGLSIRSIGFSCEGFAGASFLRFDGCVWDTDKDGIMVNLLAAEIIAVTGKRPSKRYAELADECGTPDYTRKDAPANGEQKASLKALSPEQISATELAGEPITAKLTQAEGNGAAIGGLKVNTDNAWFAARPSGTEDKYKIYAESFVDENHLTKVQEEPQSLVARVLADKSTD